MATASIEVPASGSPGALTSPVIGVLLTIDAKGLTDVKGFTLRTGDGRELVFEIGTLENGAEFPPGHLAEHLAGSTPVRVFFRADGRPAGGLPPGGRLRGVVGGGVAAAAPTPVRTPRSP